MTPETQAAIDELRGLITMSGTINYDTPLGSDLGSARTQAGQCGTIATVSREDRSGCSLPQRSHRPCGTGRPRAKFPASDRVAAVRVANA